MLKIETIRYLLKDTATSEVARATGISKNIIYNMRRKEHQYPAYKGLAAVSEYFEKKHATAMAIEEGQFTDEEVAKMTALKRGRKTSRIPTKRPF